MARLANGDATSISMSFLVMCAEKILKLLRLFFVFLFACLCSPRQLHASPEKAWKITDERWNAWQVTA